jgi:c(7)-type cytochrome triheme protein
MKLRGELKKRWIKLVVLVAGCCCAVSFVVSDGNLFAVSAKPESEFSFALTAASAEQGNQGFSRFSHSNRSHERLPCLLCHRRESNAPRPIRSLKHTPCSGCHAQQFAASSGPICGICHINVESQASQVKPFPSLKSFNMTFAHGRHRNVGCATCHKPASNGVALAIPSGARAHATCYQCHTPRAQANGRDISSCTTCHKAGRLTRASTSSKAFKANFSHERHRNQGMSCLECHKITGLPSRSAQISSPLPTEHPASSRGQSCETCHNDEKAFGIASFANCKRCHQGPTFRF